MNEIINFLVNLASAGEEFGNFIQEGATPNTAKEAMRAFRGVFGEFNWRIEL
jgi:hypothetical protein